MAGSLIFKIADTAAEHELIHRLNHRTFALEIPQHAPDPQGRLVDRFHVENTYAVCLDGPELVGMVAGRSRRPFSLDGKLDRLDVHLPAGRVPVEIRLLAVEPAYRSSTVLARLIAMIAGHFVEQGCDLAIISGTTRALAMYRRMGFVPFGPLTGVPGAQFQPMYLTAEDVRRSKWAAFTGTDKSRPNPPRPAGTPPLGGSATPEVSRLVESFLPGPVTVAPEVTAALSGPARYHRDARYMADLHDLHGRLARLVRAEHAQLLMGSGTLANDVVAGQLSKLDGGRSRGIVLSNGEFGQRLVDHATRFGLDFDVLSSDWGSPLDLDRLTQMLATGSAGDSSQGSGQRATDQHAGGQCDSGQRDGGPGDIRQRDGGPGGGTRPAWVWAVHCETSTGVLADLPRLTELCRTYQAKLCVDAISSLGALDVDLSGAWLATGASGKALGSYPGISMVFYQQAPPAGGLPRYLDLGELVASEGVAFTQSSNLVAALDAALAAGDWPDRYRQLADGSSWLAARLRRLGFEVVAPAGHAGPGICTVALPALLDAQVVGERMAADGYLLAYQSGYLRQRNWLQISLMGRWTWPVLRALPAALGRAAQPA